MMNNYIVRYFSPPYIAKGLQMNENIFENEFNENSVNDKVHNGDINEISENGTALLPEEVKTAEAADDAAEAVTLEAVAADDAAEPATLEAVAPDDAAEPITLEALAADDAAEPVTLEAVAADDAAEPVTLEAVAADEMGEEIESGATNDVAEEYAENEAEAVDTVFVAEDSEPEEDEDGTDSKEIDGSAADADEDFESENYSDEEKYNALPYAEQEDEEEDDDDDDDEEKIGNRFIDGLFDFIELFIFSLAAVFIITTFFFRHSVVDGTSMERTLFHGEHIIISDLFYTPERGDIVVCEDYSLEDENMRKPIVKRVIAIAGDTVEIDELGNVKVNGALIDESNYLYESPEHPKHYEKYSVTVKEGEVFVMGDHRNVSSDSRRVGPIKEDSILGKVLFRFYPFEKFGKVE